MMVFLLVWGVVLAVTGLIYYNSSKKKDGNESFLRIILIIEIVLPLLKPFTSGTMHLEYFLSRPLKVKAAAILILLFLHRIVSSIAMNIAALLKKDITERMSWLIGAVIVILAFALMI